MLPEEIIYAVITLVCEYSFTTTVENEVILNIFKYLSVPASRVRDPLGVMVRTRGGYMDINLYKGGKI